MIRHYDDNGSATPEWLRDAAEMEHEADGMTVPPQRVVEVTLTLDEATQLLALAVQYTVANRADTPSRIVTRSAMKKLEKAI